MFATRFAQLLIKNNESMYKVSKNTGISDSLLGTYKRGIRKPSPKNLEILAEYFNVTTDYLLTGKEEPYPILHIPEELKDVKVAFSGDAFDDLTQSEIDALAAIAKTLKEQRKI
ncbi:MAG: helix-turn-helix domain-containing protein [Defluviitaleaceae bacterium]|nr:helix-turn-helix domain-containing protein [Defluviitaleaceae bacterium]